MRLVDLVQTQGQQLGAGRVAAPPTATLLVTGMVH